MNAHKAIEALQGFAEAKLFPVEVCEFFIQKIEEAEKFVFEYEAIPSLTEDRLYGALATLRLPYPLCYFEVPSVGSMLILEYDGDKHLMPVQMFIPIGGNQWLISDPDLHLAIDKKKHALVSTRGELSTISDPKIANRWLKMIQESGHEEEIRWLVVMPNLVIRGLAALNCSNVRTVDNPPPAALNKKRLRAGKVPLFSYKTLHLHTQKSHALRREGAESGRVGPRLHLRRGHIRRLSETTTVWVTSCMVGDPSRGRVVKDYHVTA